ncbi:MAG: NAD(P)-dependent oxidoreductase [Candidatus Methanosuratincola petrocarbonis]
MRVLVTGATGFIGAHVAEHFRKKGAEVEGVCRSYNPNSVLAIKGVECKLYFADLTNFEEVRRIMSNGYDVVVHCAAQAIVRNAMRDPVGTFATNVMGTVNVLEAARLADVGKVVVFSTDKVYSETVKATENNPILPPRLFKGVYETSKAAADLAAQCFADVYGMKVIVVRPANVYGFDPWNRRIIPNTIRSCIRGESPVIFVEKEPSYREYIHVSDVCRAVELLVDKVDRGVFNVGSGEVKTQEEVVLETLKHFEGLKPRYVERPNIPEIKRQSLDSTKIRALGWKPKVDFSTGIRMTVEEFKRFFQFGKP